MIEQSYKIALLFNANKIYDRGVMQGIGQFIQASQCTWIFLWKTILSIIKTVSKAC